MNKKEEKPQYRIFYSWQSDNIRAKEVLQRALDDIKDQLKGEGVFVSIEHGGGCSQFISIEDSVLTAKSSRKRVRPSLCIWPSRSVSYRLIWALIAS